MTPIDRRARAARRLRSGAAGSHCVPWLLLVPALVGLLVFTYWPLAQTLFLSTQTSDLFGRPSGFAGLDAYVALVSDPEFGRTLLTTLVFVVLTVVGKIVASLALAVPLARRLRGSGFARASVLVPMAVSAAVAGLAFRALMTPTTGALDQLGIALTGGAIGWLTTPAGAMASIVLVDVWTSLGFVTLLLVAAIDGIPEDVLEAAALDGAGAWRRLVSVTLPTITPTLFFVVVTQTMQATREFTVIDVVTGGGPAGSTTTLVFEIYQQAFGGTANYAASSAMGVLLLVLVGILTIVQFRVLERRVHY